MPYFDDDGNEYNMDLYPVPNLCVSCQKYEMSKEEIVCNLTRMDQIGEKEFICFAYKNKFEESKQSQDSSNNQDLEI